MESLLRVALASSRSPAPRSHILIANEMRSPGSATNSQRATYKFFIANEFRLRSAPQTPEALLRAAFVPSRSPAAPRPLPLASNLKPRTSRTSNRYNKATFASRISSSFSDCRRRIAAIINSPAQSRSPGARRRLQYGVNGLRRPAQIAIQPVKHAAVRALNAEAFLAEASQEDIPKFREFRRFRSGTLHRIFLFERIAIRAKKRFRVRFVVQGQPDDKDRPLRFLVLEQGVAISMPHRGKMVRVASSKKLLQHFAKREFTNHVFVQFPPAMRDGRFQMRQRDFARLNMLKIESRMHDLLRGNGRILENCFEVRPSRSGFQDVLREHRAIQIREQQFVADKRRSFGETRIFHHFLGHARFDERRDIRHF